MRHRSFYMRSVVADQLSEVVDDLHYATRQPRHEVLAALVDVALRHRAEIEERLKQPEHDGPGDGRAGHGKAGASR